MILTACDETGISGGYTEENNRYPLQVPQLGYTLDQIVRKLQGFFICFQLNISND